MNFTNFLPSGATLHRWQEQFLSKFIESSNLNALKEPAEREAFILNAFPSAGKTWAQLVGISYLLHQETVDLAVVIVPTRKLKQDFAEEALGLFGLITHAKNQLGTFNPYKHKVLVLTYGQLLTQREFLSGLCENYNVLVSADEMHHLAKRRSWGGAFVDSFSKASVRLLTTGTPFRSDGEPMPWVRTKENKIDLTGPHAYSYGYGFNDLNKSLSALSDEVATPVIFHPWDGQVSFVEEVTLSNGQKDSRHFNHKLSDNLDEIYKHELAPREIKRLKKIRREFVIECDQNGPFPDGTQYVQDQISLAHKKLTEIREDHPHASGMIVCKDINHANSVAQVVRKLTGTEPVVIHGKEEEYAASLLAFQKGYSPNREQWLISVKMVSEGVNINHMRVLVYLTDITAPMLWTQIIGRAIRYDKSPNLGLQHQTAHVFQYDDGMDLNDEGESVPARLRLYAKTMEQEHDFTVRTIQEMIEPPEDIWDQEPSNSGDGGEGDSDVLDVFPPDINKLQIVLRNLGATGVQTEQIYRGESYLLKDLEAYEVPARRIGIEPATLKHMLSKLHDPVQEYFKEFYSDYTTA